MDEKELKEIEERLERNRNPNSGETIPERDMSALLKEVRRLRGLVDAGGRWADAAVEITKMLERGEDALVEERAAVIAYGEGLRDDWKKFPEADLYEKRARSELQSEGKIPKRASATCSD